VTFVHKAASSFWDRYRRLPQDVRDRADAQFDLLLANAWHPSLRLKRTGAFWSARVTDGYRALAIREGRTFTWFWIGDHDEYERLLKG